MKLQNDELSEQKHKFTDALVTVKNIDLIEQHYNIYFFVLLFRHHGGKVLESAIHQKNGEEEGQEEGTSTGCD